MQTFSIYSTRNPSLIFTAFDEIVYFWLDESTSLWRKPMNIRPSLRSVGLCSRETAIIVSLLCVCAYGQRPRLRVRRITSSISKLRSSPYVITPRPFILLLRRRWWCDRPPDVKSAHASCGRFTIGYMCQMASSDCLRAVGLHQMTSLRIQTATNRTELERRSQKTNGIATDAPNQLRWFQLSSAQLRKARKLDWRLGCKWGRTVTEGVQLADLIAVSWLNFTTGRVIRHPLAVGFPFGY
jgi:hypothetical protein